jgi:HSP20 family molecular chaperone IbpA
MNPRSALAPQVLAERPPTAEVLVAPHALVVTISLPQSARADVDVLLTRHSIRLRHKSDPAQLNLVIPLPVAVEPERYVLRESHGVYDFVVERASH